MGLPWWRVEAFVEDGALGNPAAVVLLDRPFAAEEMQAIASKLAMPATAFVLPLDERRLHPIRWFDRASEIALCGHGSLAATHVLLSELGQSPAGFRTASGVAVDVKKVAQGRYAIALPALDLIERHIAGIGEALGDGPEAVLSHDAGYIAAIFTNADQVRSLAPDPATLAAFGFWQVSVSAPGRAGGEDIVTRVFTRSGGEDAATGSAHAAFAKYWAARLGRDSFSSWQASSRGARLECRVEGGRVWIGGACRTSAESYLTG